MIYITEVSIEDGVLKKVICNNIQDDNSEEITIIVPESVKEIADDSFGANYNFRSVVSIHLPKTVEKFSAEAFYCYMTDFPKLASIEVDPENPFYQSIDGVLYSKAGDTLIHCPHTRTSLHIPEGVTAIDVSAFRRCQELAEIVLPATLSTIRKRAFYCCESLANLVIPEGVISIGEEAFSNCKALKEVTLPSSLKEISPFAFSDCASLTKIVIPEGVTSIGDSAFSGCSSLTEVTLPKSLTVLGERAFAYCPSLLSPITKNPFEPKKPMKYVSDCFDVEYDVLTQVLLTSPNPDGAEETLVVPASVEKIAPYAFSYDGSSYYTRPSERRDLKNVVSIHLPKSVKKISSDAFGQYLTLPKLSSIEVDPENPCYQSIDGVLYSRAGDTLIRCPHTKTSLHIPEGVITIADSALRGCNLTEVTLPQSLKTIEARAFASCKYLTKLVIPDGVTSIGEDAFMASCLTDITLSKSLKAIEAWTFCDCNILKKVAIPEGVTSIGEKAFLNCDALAEVTLPNSLKTIGIEAFYECHSLQKLVIPEGVTSIGKEAFYRSGLTNLTLLCAELNTFDHAFDECKRLSKVTLPDGLRMIDAGAFVMCESLESIVLPKSIQKIAESAFYFCSSLPSIVLPDGVKEIEPCAFVACSSLTELSIPESVSVIGKGVIAACKALKHITLHNAQGQYLTSMLHDRRLYYLADNLFNADPPIVHIEDITALTAKYRVYAAIGFALDHRDCTDENGEKYLKYIKANAVRLASAAVEYRELFDLMLREQLIAAKDLEAFSAIIQASGQADLIAALQAYAEQLPAPKKRKQ